MTTAAFSKDGSGVLFNVQAQSATGPGWIGKVTFDGVYSTVAEVVGLHTDFVELDEGRLAALTWEVRDVGDFRLLGDHVVVVEGGRPPSGTRSTRCPSTRRDSGPQGFTPPIQPLSTWSHVNSISWDGASNDLVVTMTASDGLARIDADTGEMLWLYGKGMGDFSGAEGLTAAPPSAEILLSGNVLVFNRGDFLGEPVEEVCSFAAELAVGESEMAEVGEWTAEACTLTTYLGLARRLSDGVTRLNGCSAGRIDQVSDAGEIVWSVGLGAGHGFGNSSFLPTAQ